MARSSVLHLRLAALLSFAAVLSLPACRTQPAPAEPTPAVADASPAKPEPAPAAGEATPPSEPTPAPEPTPPPEPEKLVAPDGTVIEPCGEVPEGMACIPGGPFLRGSDDGPKNTRPQETVWLQTFYMDLNEVTYKEYKDCQATKKCKRGGPLYNDYDHPRQPITGPSWYAAVKYCEVAGKHLPTEAQWEKAARGPDGNLYPWGNEDATCERAIIMNDKGERGCGVLKKKEQPWKSKPWEIGSRPPYVYGLYDMAGNSWEWVYDWDSRSYAACGDKCRGTDPKGPCDGKEPCAGHEKRVVRGGSWYWDKTYATAIHRRTHFPANDPKVEFHHFGFRCSASLEEGKALLEAQKAAKAAGAAEGAIDAGPAKAEGAKSAPSTAPGK
jgi:sulfatase modifying factor 1